jgi:sensor domain CHASE-containing protein
MQHLSKWFPFFAFLIFGGISVLLWQNQNRYERELVLRHTETSSEQIRIRIEGLMNARMASLELLAERWVERIPPDFSQTRFLDFAEMFYSHYPGFMGINWIDPTGVVRWVFPENINERVIDTPIFRPLDSSGQNKFHILHTDQSIVTPIMELIQGGLGYNTFLPLVYSGKIQGYLNGVFQVKRIVDICLAKEIFTDFWIRLHEGDRGVPQRIGIVAVFPEEIAGLDPGFELIPAGSRMFAAGLAGGTAAVMPGRRVVQVGAIRQRRLVVVLVLEIAGLNHLKRGLPAGRGAARRRRGVESASRHGR